MLSKSTVVSSYDLAESLAAQGKIVQSRSNTVMADLDNATITNDLIQAAFRDIDNWENFDIDAFAQLVSHVTHNYDTPTAHDMKFDSYVNDIKNQVSKHLKFARNVVKPIVVDYAARLQTYLSHAELQTAESQFDIRIVEMPEPLVDDVFKNIVMEYTGRPLVPSKELPVQAFESTDELLSFIATGEATVDQSITAWFHRTLPEVNLKVANELVSYTNVDFMAGHDQSAASIDRVMLAFLISSAAANKGERNHGKMMSQVFARIAKEWADYAGAILRNLIVQMNALEKTNVVVLYSSKPSKTVYVLGNNYRRWLNEGGLPEYLYAVITMYPHYKTIDVLKTQSATLSREWNSYKLFWTNAQNTQKLSIVKEGIAIVFQQVMETVSDEEKLYIQTDSGYSSSVDRRLRVIIDSLRLSDLEDINALALKVICSARFYYTDAEFILSEIEQAGRANPGIDVTEAALLATINYIVDYICDQLMVTTKL